MNATTAASPSIILCADDFGISAGVNRAILDLAAKGRLSAVTCMSLGEAWEDGAPALKACKVTAGLHITLTYLPPLVKDLGARHPSELALGLKSWARLLDKKLIEEEIRAQFIRFIAVWGAPPAFIDGHQHVHVLPVVRDIVLALREEFAPQAWVRNIVDLSAVIENWKNSVYIIMGWRFRHMLKKCGIPFNTKMRGAYDRATPGAFAAALEAWCSAPTLIYCHPGFPDAQLAKYDSLLEPRRQEYDFLNSDVFGTWSLNMKGQP
jgi:hypothetical protein